MELKNSKSSGFLLEFPESSLYKCLNFKSFQINYYCHPTQFNDSCLVTHLANQHYVACWRRESGYCAVCFYPKVTITTVAGNVAATQSSFGLS